MSRILAVIMIVVTAALIVAGTAPTRQKEKTSTPDGAVQAFLEHVKSDDYRGAFALVSPSSNVDVNTVYHDIAGRNGSLKTLSHLWHADTRVLAQNGNEALVRANLEWETAVGALHENRDLKLVNDNGTWQIVWPKRHEQNLPPQ